LTVLLRVSLLPKVKFIGPVRQRNVLMLATIMGADH
jgi:hypothetical protein